jgi:HSP20 family protein
MQQLPLDAIRHFWDQQMMPMLHKLLPYGVLGPRVEVRQTPNHILVTAEIPGLKQPGDLDLHVQEIAITISGRVEREESSEEGFDLFHTERLYGAFSRTVPLPVLVDPKTAEANYQNGLLTVKMQKSVDVQGRQVPIRFS